MPGKYSPFFSAHCIRCRLPVTHCVCPDLRSCSVPLSIHLLSHNKEWNRNDNTGQWLHCSDRGTIIHRWQRKSSLAESGPVPTASGQRHFLLFPDEHAVPVSESGISTMDNLWIPDGTWQEAAKIIRQSPWLQSLPSVRLSDCSDSLYTLRRNQKGVCTMEAVIRAIKETHPGHPASHDLDHNFQQFCQRFDSLKHYRP